MTLGIVDASHRLAQRASFKADFLCTLKQPTCNNEEGMSRNFTVCFTLFVLLDTYIRTVHSI